MYCTTRHYGWQPSPEDLLIPFLSCSAVAQRLSAALTDLQLGDDGGSDFSGTLLCNRSNRDVFTKVAEAYLPSPPVPPSAPNDTAIVRVEHRAAVPSAAPGGATHGAA